MLALLLMLFAWGVQSPVSGQNAERTADSLNRCEMMKGEIQRRYLAYKPFFDKAYLQYPDVPRGVLEAVAYTYNRFAPPILKDTVEEGNAMPRTYGVMGLTLHGKGVFRENLRSVAALSGFQVDALLKSDSLAMLAYAKAFSVLQVKQKAYGKSMKMFLPVLVELSELPKVSPDKGNYALRSSLYAVCWAMAYLDSILPQMECVQIDMEDVFGEELPLLRGEARNVVRQGGRSEEPDYAGAVWVPAAACNYSKGRSLPVSNVTIHYTQGTYSGSIAWFQNCSASASAHYVVRSFDGQVTQMVHEADKAWHVGNSNGYTIGIEHEAYGDIVSFFTPAMYASSANLVRDIVGRYPVISTHHTFYQDTLDNGTVLNAGLHSLGGRTTCTQIRGHQHFPEQTHTDPGPFWNWNYYYKLLNQGTIASYYNTWEGTLSDDGGTAGNYTDDVRRLYLIDVGSADSIALEFTTFDVEANNDFLWIYRGTTPFAPLVGRWNTHSPGRVVVPGGQLLLEFRSNCSGNASGWVARWRGITHTIDDAEDVILSTTILLDEDEWISSDFVARFQDEDSASVERRYFQVMEKNGNVWTASRQNGFLCDNFDNATSLNAWDHAASWTIENHAFVQQDATAVGCSAFTSHWTQNYESHLYDFYLSFLQGESCSFYWDCSNNRVGQTNFCGYQMRLDKTDNTLDLYRIENGVATLLVHKTHIYHTFEQSYLYRVVWERDVRRIRVFRHSTLLVDVCVGAPAVSWMPCAVGFLTDGARVSIDNLRAYASRSETALVTVGGGGDKMITQQAVAGTSTCKLKSIVLDTAGNFSPLVEKSLKVDYTPPTKPRSVTLQLLTPYDQDMSNVFAEWSECSDQQSGLNCYQYSFQRVSDVIKTQRIRWTDNAMRTSVRDRLQLGAGEQVCVMVQAVDNAGNVSVVGNSPLMLKTPQGVSRKTLQTSEGGPVLCEVFAMSGQLLMSNRVENGAFSKEMENLLADLPAGVYVLRFSQDGKAVRTEKCVVP